MMGIHIANLRRQVGLSQAALADELHVSPSTVGMYEQGRREPSIQVVIRMARVFGVSVDYLLTGKICIEDDIVAFLKNEQFSGKTGTAVTGTKFLSREEIVVLRAALFMDESIAEDKVEAMLRMLNDAGVERADYK